MKLSREQRKCVDHMRLTGEMLRRYPGGFWACPSDMPEGRVNPTWHVGTLTVRALWTRGVLETEPWTDPYLEDGIEPWEYPYRLATAATVGLER